MVTQLLINILENQSERMTGADIKAIVEAIQISESMVKTEVKEKESKTPEQIIKDWMGE